MVLMDKHEADARLPNLPKSMVIKTHAGIELQIDGNLPVVGDARNCVLDEELAGRTILIL